MVKENSNLRTRILDVSQTFHQWFERNWKVRVQRNAKKKKQKLQRLQGALTSYET